MKKVKNTIELKQSNQCLLDLCLERLGLGKYNSVVRSVLLEYEGCNIPHEELLESVLDAVVAVIDSQKAEMRTSMARFPSQANLENFDFSRISQQVETRVRGFSTNCSWIKHCENILFKGPSGVGKTHLSIALGRQATTAGYSTLFITANELFGSLNLAIKRNSYESKLRSLQRNDLLIIDDLGIPVKMEATNGKLFYDIMQGRCGKKSTIITTNRKVTDWFEALGGDVVSVRAGLDRFLETCHRVEINGKSYRLESFKKINGESWESKQAKTEDSAVADVELTNLDGVGV
jgi:DNA replication protein DnaC